MPLFWDSVSPHFGPRPHRTQVCNYGAGGPDAGGRGDGGMTLNEYRSSYSIWAVIGSPLIISADLRHLQTDHPECLSMLLNKMLLAISQDPLSRPGNLVYQTTNATDKAPGATATTNIVEQIWTKDLSRSRRALLFFNRGETSRTMSLSWAQAGLDTRSYFAIDVWGERPQSLLSPFTNISVLISPHAVAVLLLEPAHLLNLK